MADFVADLAFPLGGYGDSVIASYADVWAADMIEIVFRQPMANNADLRNRANYTVAANDNVSRAPQVVDVRTGDDPSTQKVYIIVDQFLIGKFYTITVGPPIVTAENEPLSTIFRTVQFEGRITKIDAVLRSKQEIFDMSPNSVYRNITSAIGREDDLLGGVRDDEISLIGKSSVVIAVTPKFFNVQLATTKQFTATITGTNNFNAVWKVNGIIGGNATVGVIVDGLYAPPLIIPTPNIIDISATSESDTTKTDFAYVVLFP